MRSAILFVVCAASAWGQQPIPPGQFDRLHALVKPQAWESSGLDDIAWMPSVRAARRKAAEQGKPILVLGTGEPPLGLC